MGERKPGKPKRRERQPSGTTPPPREHDQDSDPPRTAQAPDVPDDVMNWTRADGG